MLDSGLSIPQANPAQLGDGEAGALARQPSHGSRLVKFPDDGAWIDGVLYGEATEQRGVGSPARQGETTRRVGLALHGGCIMYTRGCGFHRDLGTRTRN